MGTEWTIVLPYSSCSDTLHDTLALSMKDACIFMAPWDSSLLLYPKSGNFPKTEKDKSIHSHSLGVFLMCAIQTQCQS